MTEKMEYFFTPESIAVIGASDKPEKGGYTLMQNLQDSFDGDLYPVNPGTDEVMGRECYDSILEVPGDVDLASILIPARFVPDTLRECVDKGVEAIFLGSGGFADAGEDGETLQAEILDIAREGDMRVWGPNCGGYISSNPSLSNCYLLDTRGHAEEYLGGNVSFISQSGMMAGGVYIEIISEELVDLGKTLTIGNRADVAESDLLPYLRDDGSTDVVGIYQESVKKGREYIDALRSTTREKPVVVLKGGRSEGGTRAARSHTGSIAGDDRLADAVFRQYGVTRVRDFRELIDVSRGFSMYPSGLPGDDIAILTMTGAGSVIGADILGDYGLNVAELSDESIERLGEIYPDWIEPMNPVDIWTTIEQIGIDETLTTCLEVLMDDDNVDGVLFQPLAFSYFEDFDFDAFTDIASRYDKPVSTWLVGWKEHTPYWIDELEENGIPVYRDMETCVKFLGEARKYAAWRERSSAHDAPEGDANADDVPAAARRILDEHDTRDGLTEAQSKEFLEAWGVPITDETVATSADEAVAAAAEIGYPVVLKVSSPDVQHKADVGGVRLDLETEAAVRAAYDEIVEAARDHAPDAEIDGVLVQEMVTGGREVIVGIQNDETYGPMVMFGLGGIFVEVLEDVSFRAAPLTEGDARQMIAEIDGHPILEGVRGQPPADVDALVDVLLTASRIATSMEDDVAELDVNPLIVFDDGEGAVAADALLHPSDG